MREATWEYDYIIKDLCSDIPGLRPVTFDGYSFNSLLIDETDIGNCSFVFNCSSIHFSDALNLIKKTQPPFIFILSDEYSTKDEWVEMQKYTKFVFRQYNHPNYKYELNNIHLPLGYVCNYPIKNKIKPISERQYNCSFVGEIKSDRHSMRDIFEINMPNTNFHVGRTNWGNPLGNDCNPTRLFDIYNDTVFVPNGRGNQSLNCFRIYEAIIAGAIPVIVGNEEEFKTTFTFENGMPPCIYASSWVMAVEICNNLLKDKKELQNKQDTLLKWYSEIIDYAKKIIKANVQTP